MMNNLTIKPTEFIDIRTGTKSYGYRIYDRYSQHYDDGFIKIPDDDIELLKRINLSGDMQIQDLLSYAVEERQGIYIGHKFYEHEEIRDIIKQGAD